MRLVIIRYDAADQVSLASGETFADAEAVRAELARLLRDGLLDPDGAYRLVDLDAAAPLVVLAAPAVADGADALGQPRSEADAFFTDDLPEPPVAVPTEPLEGSEAVEEPFASGVLADLAEEDTSAEELEMAGGDAAQQWPWDLPGADDGEKEDATTAEETEVSDAEAESDADAEAGSDPDAETESDVDPAAVEPDVEAEAPEDGAGDPADGSGAPADEDPSLNDDLAAVAASLAEKMSEEPALVSEPIRLGDDDAADSDADAAPAGVGSDEQQLEDMGVAEPQGVIDAAADSVAMEAGDGEADRVYEPGALNMEEYTCDDCVYVNTCPNQHQKKPAECGSFQWKSM